MGCRVQVPSLVLPWRTQRRHSNPSWACFMDREAAGSRSAQISLYPMATAAFPHPQVQHAGEELSPKADKQIPWNDPGACPLLGDSAANQAGHAWHWPLSLTPAIPTPAPATTGSHLLWQTASFKLLTPVILIQGVTGDLSLPRLGERNHQSVCPSSQPASQPSSQSPAPTSFPQPNVHPDGKDPLPGVQGEVSRPTTTPSTERGYWVSKALNTHTIPYAIKLGEPPFSLFKFLLGHLWNPKG